MRTDIERLTFRLVLGRPICCCLVILQQQLVEPLLSRTWVISNSSPAAGNSMILGNRERRPELADAPPSPGNSKMTIRSSVIFHALDQGVNGLQAKTVVLAPVARHGTPPKADWMAF